MPLTGQLHSTKDQADLASRIQLPAALNLAVPRIVIVVKEIVCMLHAISL